MEPEHYKVEVLHFLNPYLIWVEVPDSDPDNDNFAYQQIGIYGVLPQEMTMNLDDTLKIKRSMGWMPAATVLMKNVLEDAIEVSFCPIHVDHRSTIFDDNTHKYGELIIKKSNGKYRLLSKLLVNSGFALQDENLFLTELSSGNIKTKLSHSKMKDIIKQLEKKCKTQVDKQTKVFQAAENIELALTIKNLEAHNRKTKQMPKDFDLTLQRKLEDLQMCKDVDVKSVGRASKKNTHSDSSSILLKKKLHLHKRHVQEFEDVKDYFIRQHIKDINALQKSPKRDTPEKQVDNIADYSEKNNDSKDDQRCDTINPLKRIQNAAQKTEVLTSKVTTDYSSEVRKDSEEAAQDPVKLKNTSFDNMNEEVSNRLRKPKKPNKSPSKVPDYDVHKEFRVVYGPPGINVNLLPCKVVPKTTFVETYTTEAREEGVQVKKGKEDIFDDEDSDVDIRSTYVTVEKTTDLKNCKAFDDSKIVKTENPEYSINDVSSKTTPQKHEVSPKEQQSPKRDTPCNSMLKRKLRAHKENLAKKLNSSATSDTSNKDSSTSIEDDRLKNVKKDVVHTTDLDSDDESVSDLIESLNAKYPPLPCSKPEEMPKTEQAQLKNYVNPFRNINENISKFVEKLVTAVLMVHSKMNTRFLPVFKLRDIPFNTQIQIVLKNMSFEKPMMIQTVTWTSILRGYSTFIIGPKRSGKTMGYLPAICRLVADKDSGIDGIGPMSIIVCATSNSVSEVEKYARIFLGSKDRVLAIYSGMDVQDIATSLLNGCDLLICTPAILVRLLQAEFGVDLRRLTSFVLDDCDRLSEVFGKEIKFFLFKIKEMYKARVHKEVKVQYILASRVWCEFMESLAIKAPDTVICIGAFQECVLYSKANTNVSFVTNEKKSQSVLEFLNDIDTSKRTVIVCRTDEEVEELEKVLKQAKYVVFACGSEMTVQDLYNLRGSWDDYKEPVISPILLCLDGNLTHLNITDAHYLIHYSLPSLFSEFCKRFSVLNDNYPSIFNETSSSDDVKIKILLEDTNMEQLPKILHFIKRCTTAVPPVLDDACSQIIAQKERMKGKRLIPICDNFMTLGECPEFWYCKERHAILKEFDEPQDWVPKDGVLTFKILHFHTAVFYSGRLLSNISKGQTTKFPQTFNMLSMKISMHFSRESNRQPHGVPEVGDICAVSIRQNFYARCQVVKILSLYQNGKPNYVLVRLIDEERLEETRDIYLFHLPEELIKTQTHVVHIRLANLQPRDKDMTFSKLAMDELKNITDSEKDLYMRGEIALTVGNCVVLKSIEVCQDLPTLDKTVVLHDFRKLLLEKHAILNEEHLQNLKKFCIEGGMTVESAPKVVEVPPIVKMLPKPQWAHLEKDDLSAVFFASAENPSTFFVRLVKFDNSCSTLNKEIQKYAVENSETVTNINVGDIVLAKLPDDDMFERARIEEVLSDEKVKCFFVDQGDWREVSVQSLAPITEKQITQLPFQAIECRLVGVKPPGENWTEFATNWFTNCFEDNYGNLKQIYVKYFTKEKSLHTGGHKYGVVLVDTNSEQDVVINELIIEVNLACEKDGEIDFLNDLNFKKNEVEVPKNISDDEDVDNSWEKVSKHSKTSVISDDFEKPQIPFINEYLQKPIRSVPLVGSDESDTSSDRWHINMTKDFIEMFNPVLGQKTPDVHMSNVPAIQNKSSGSGSDVSASLKSSPTSTKDDDSKSSSEVSSSLKPCKNLRAVVNKSSGTDTDSSIQKLSLTSDIQVVPSPNVKQLDSDDYTSPEDSLLVTKNTHRQNLLKEVCTIRNKEKDTQNKATDKNNYQDPESLKKPKLLWHQKKKNVYIKILLIGADKYEVTVEERRLKFYGIANDTEYGFDLELYGVVNKNLSLHSNKGQYIWVNLYKVLDRNWLTLTRSCGIQKWIVYNVDAIDVESSEEEGDDIAAKEAIKGLVERAQNSDTEDEDLIDDAIFGYSR